MRFNKTFKEKILPFNNSNVDLTIINITANNHALGPMGMMMMGNQQIERVALAGRDYYGNGEVIKLKAKMEFVESGQTEKVEFTIDGFSCNKIVVFRPNPPMIIQEKDMSLWWSYYSDDENNDSGDSFPIRDVMINGISHCLQPLD